MAAPNIVATTSIYGKSDSGALTTGSADLLANGSSSNKLLRVNSLYVSNIDGANACNVTITFFDASRSATRSLANVVTVPAKSTIVVISKDTLLSLEEGDKISGLASANGDLEWVISWDEIG
jgi:hypothetical protein